jgi:hypothetical protein
MPYRNNDNAPAEGKKEDIKALYDMLQRKVSNHIHSVI